MTDAPRLRTLLFSSLYPSSVRPGHGIFVETRLRELLSSDQVTTHVVAPVPWFPSQNPRWGEYARMASTPKRESRNGIDVLHPRYFLPPKVGMTLAPLSMALGALPAIRRLQAEGHDFDVIDAHYFYPDGVAAALLSRWLNKPFVITARGSDLNLLRHYALPRRMMQWAAAKASASIGVCAALVDVLRTWGLPESRLHVMRNGVDLQRFRPLPQAQMRKELDLAGSPILLSVGHLVELKGHRFLIEALATLQTTHPQARLVIVGEGPERSNLLALARRLGVDHRVTLTGALPNADLLRWYSAADLLLLASSREGWANVLLEAMACGTPVVATAVGGSPEVVADPVAGVLVEQASGTSFAAAIRHMLSEPIDRVAVRAYAENFGWSQTTGAQVALFKAVSLAVKKDG
ncbi:MAG: glycosyltransferase family 4 protein [Paucibacter sp.]|nr:glycosyltransferase family 4 protein [Roseateles sp.]